MDAMPRLRSMRGAGSLGGQSPVFARLPLGTLGLRGFAPRLSALHTQKGSHVTCRPAPCVHSNICERSPIVQRPSVFLGTLRTKMVEKRIGGWRAVPRRLAGLVRTAWPRRGLVAEACAQLALVETKLRLFPL